MKEFFLNGKCHRKKQITETNRNDPSTEDGFFRCFRLQLGVSSQCSQHLGDALHARGARDTLRATWGVGKRNFWRCKHLVYSIYYRNNMFTNHGSKKATTLKCDLVWIIFHSSKTYILSLHAITSCAKAHAWQKCIVGNKTSLDTRKPIQSITPSKHTKWKKRSRWPCLQKRAGLPIGIDLSWFRQLLHRGMT